MKIFVTGSNGFTGKYLLPFLSMHGCLVAGGARDSDNQTVYSIDLLDKNSLVKALTDFQPDVIVHLAGIALPGFTDVELIYRINMFGTKNLLDAVVESGIKLHKFIAASSAHVYGVVDSLAVSESHIVQPMSHYGNSKLGMENICRLYMDKLPIIITRPFNYTGAGQSTDYVLAKIVDHYRRGAKEITLGNIDVVRDFSHIEDVLNYYWQLINCKDDGFVVNLCSGVGFSLCEIIEQMNVIAGYEINVNSSNALLRPQDNPVFVGDNSLLMTYMPNHTSMTMLKLLRKMYIS